ncbi:Uu.00g091120.m01.CDS01 [Anthostomella pinea]|uniref:Uu.00g091120.m01.CDS01 n=1 Tax=Anthostomella pinea TaxID=933095 RepID=A0AAI8VMZ4_9PEZI|nr:Uu.00g091120.m01.CDS01 [Anthostomella pinea]
MRLAILSSLALLAIAPPSSVFAEADCSEPLVRKEWRTLSSEEKQSYLSAVQCLQKTPGKTSDSYPGVQSRYDDFQAEHIQMTDLVHFVGFFQPWHRMFVAQYESDLRSWCNYTGAQPYWDWSLDAVSPEAFLKAPVFDAVDGFGGNGPYVDSANDPSVVAHIPGKTGGGCITDGPFKDRKVSMGPGKSTKLNPHCLRRDIAPEFAASKLNSTMVDWVLSADNFLEFDIRVQGGISADAATYHGGGHRGVGGDLGEIADIYSSPGDPLFFMHHANMDRLWHKWQHLDWDTRQSDIGGPDTQFAYPFDFFGTNPSYANVTLNYKMTYHNLVPGPFVKVRDVMETQKHGLCYTYE